MTVFVEHATDHRREQLAVADERRLGAREARTRGIHGASDDQEDERRARRQLGESMLEHGQRGWVPHLVPVYRAGARDATTRRPLTSPQGIQHVMMLLHGWTVRGMKPRRSERSDRTTWPIRGRCF